MGDEVHILQNFVEYNKILSLVKNRPVLELGVGTGALTQAIINAGAKWVSGYEILENICQVSDKKLCLHTNDFTKVDFSYLKYDDYCLVSNPPYSTLDFICGTILPLVKDAIIMVPEWREDEMESIRFKRVFDLHEDDFAPAAKGTHLVMRRGF